MLLTQRIRELETEISAVEKELQAAGHVAPGRPSIDGSGDMFTAKITLLEKHLAQLLSLKGAGTRPRVAARPADVQGSRPITTPPQRSSLPASHPWNRDYSR